MSSSAGRAPTAAELELHAQAREVASRAYAPYSGYAVGAVVTGPSGVARRGVNVENASYPAGVCAERVALGALVAGGERRVDAVAVAAADGRDVVPCGLCLQALAEFGDPAIVGVVDGHVRVFGLRELLTAPFAAPGDAP